MDKVFNIDTEDVGRIDKFLSQQLPEYSRSFIQKSLQDGLVLVNDSIIKSNYKLRVGDIVQFNARESIEPDILAENLDLDIIYEDCDILVVNKPKGMVVHPAPGHYSGTLVNGIMYHCKETLSGINGVMRPGIVHRIDMNTTGSLVVCKNDKSHQYVADLLKEHRIDRKYRAIVHGVIKDDIGTIEGPIGRDEKDRKRMSINYRNGKDAITHYRVIRRFENHTYVECELETGRTHQIRVHMASINHPLIGDSTYTNRKSKFKLEGQTLHAYTLGFDHPRTGEYLLHTAPIPDYFEKLLKNL